MKRICFVFLLLCGLSACSREEAPSPARKASAIKFAAVRTDAISEGTRIGLFMGAPLSYSNVLLTVGKDGELQSAEELLWKPGQTETSALFAYSPYQENAGTDGKVSFTQAKDQRVAADVTDLLAAFTNADPASAGLQIDFVHQMAQLCLDVKNKTAVKVSKVVVLGVLPTITLDVTTGAVSVSGTPVDITCDDKEASAYEEYYALIPPQEMELNVTVFFEDGKESNFAFEKQNFCAGKSYNGTFVLSDEEQGGKMSLSFRVSDWVDGGDLRLKEEEKPQAGETATLAYADVKASYSYGKEQTHDGWVFACYSDGTENTCFQLNGGKVAYIGTPEFSNPIITLTINAKDAYSDDLYICSSNSSTSTSASGIVRTVKGEGKTTVVDLSGESLNQVYIRSAKVIRIVSVEVSSEKEEPVVIDETAFTKSTGEGMYSATDTDSPVVNVNFAELQQTSCGKSATSRTVTALDFETGYYMLMTVNATSFSVGKTCSATVNFCGLSTTYDSLVCVNKTSEKAWLEDKTAHVGFIIPVEK